MRFLAAPPEGIRLFLVYGSDPGAITERARQLEQIALKRGGGDAVLRFGSDELSADPGRIADEAYSASLFGGEPVIALRVLDGRHNVIGARAAAARPPARSRLADRGGGRAGTTSPLRKAFEDVAQRRRAADLCAGGREPDGLHPRRRGGGRNRDRAGGARAPFRDARRRPAREPRRTGEALPLRRR